VVAGVQHPPPEHPNPLPLQPTEEGTLLQPPRGRATGELRQPPPHEPEVLVDVRLRDGLFAGRQELFDRRLLCGDKLGEEAALREKLVNQDRANRVRLLVWFEVEDGICYGPLHAHGLVRFPHVGRDNVLEDRLDRLR
jgi:hypothetical protein